jgi:predicted Zn-dependent protease
VPLFVYALAVLLTGCHSQNTQDTTATGADSPNDLQRPPSTVRSYQYPLYLVGIGDVQGKLLEDIAAYYKDHLQIDVRLLDPIPIPKGAINPSRNQIAAEDLLQEMRRKYPEHAGDYMFGVAAADIYSRELPYQFVFSSREGNETSGLAVVAYARLDPRFLGQPANDDLFGARLRKQLTRNIGLLFLHQSPNENPHSVLYKSVMGLDDLDRMGYAFD